jgi:hypothetical protein
MNSWTSVRRIRFGDGSVHVGIAQDESANLHALFVQLIHVVAPLSSIGEVSALLALGAEPQNVPCVFLHDACDKFGVADGEPVSVELDVRCSLRP